MPAHPHTSAVVLDRLCFTWPDGSPALDDVSGAIGEGRTGLVGRNGSGKSTLLRLIAGEIAPASGTVTTSGDVALLPQQLTRDTGRPVADLLGIGPILAALRAIESGDADPRHFEAVGDAWDIESRAHAALAGAGLAPDVLDRTVGELSGGEAVLAAIAGIRLRKPAITLLDEPTNNLDRDARARLAGLVTAWPGALVVVSHDTALLELMDDTAELHDGTLSVFGGPYSRWRSWLDAEQEAARRAEATAAQDVRREKRQRIEAETTIARRRAVGAKAEREKRVPPIVAGNRKRAARSRPVDFAPRAGRRRREPARPSMRPNGACATTTPSESTCPTPAFPPAGASPPSTTAIARGSCRGPSASRSSVRTAPARPGCWSGWSPAPFTTPQERSSRRLIRPIPGVGARK